MCMNWVKIGLMLFVQEMKEGRGTNREWVFVECSEKQVMMQMKEDEKRAGKSSSHRQRNKQKI